MSRRGNIRKRDRQRKRHEQRPRELAAPVSAITGEEQAVYRPRHVPTFVVYQLRR